MDWMKNLERNNPVSLEQGGKKYDGYVVASTRKQIIACFPDAPFFKYESGSKPMAAFETKGGACVLGEEYGHLIKAESKLELK